MPITTSENDIKERLSIAYVTAVAARAGCQITKLDIDKQSIDAIVKPVSGAKLQIDLQLKATSRSVLVGSEVVVDLPIKNYDDLRDPVTTAPHYLVVLALPDDPEAWLSLTDSELILRGCAYWESLIDKPPSENETSQRIRFSQAQKFDPEALRGMMVRARIALR